MENKTEITEIYTNWDDVTIFFPKNTKYNKEQKKITFLYSYVEDPIYSHNIYICSTNHLDGYKDVDYSRHYSELGDTKNLDRKNIRKKLDWRDYYITEKTLAKYLLSGKIGDSFVKKVKEFMEVRP